MPRRYEPEKKHNTNKVIIIGAIAAVVIVGGLVLLNTVGSTPATPQTANASRDWGSLNAPITVVEYSDFQ